MPDPAAPSRPRARLHRWGFADEVYSPSPALLTWLAERIGTPAALPPPTPPGAKPLPAPARLPELAGLVSLDPLDRLAHSRGRGLSDLLRLRTGTVPAAPDAVVRPGGDAEVEAVLAACAAAGVRVVPWGGGTSVTGGLNLPPGGPPAVALDLERLAFLEALDEESGLAVLGAGLRGPAVEASLGERGFTLGHFPQSFELSTLGGWVATRASGQESLGYGAIHDLVAGVDLVAPAGRLTLPAFPATAAGPDLRQLVLGSEGRLGVVTRATVRVRPRPATREAAAYLLPDWQAGLAAARDLVRSGVPLTLLRLSDAPETEVALALGLASRRWLAPALRAWLRLHGVRRSGSACLLLAGAAGEPPAVEEAFGRAGERLRRHGAAALGRRPGRRWLGERFRHPYLRDELLDRGIATDTLETAGPWSRLPELGERVRAALAGGLAADSERVAVLCHLSHAYPDGASLYFTFFFRCPADPDAAIARWAVLKRAATGALAGVGGTVSHHHGVGSWHAPWLPAEVGETGMRTLAAAAAALDPAGILNPQALLAREDRLEV